MLVNLRALFGSLVDLVLLRRGPETLPASPAVLAIVVALNAAVTALVVVLIPAIPGVTPFELIVSAAVPLLWYWISFSLAKKPERFVQTMIAFFGVNVMFQPLLLPMYAALMPYIQKPDPNLPPPAALSLLSIGISVWLAIVWVRVIHAAFEWHYAICVVFLFAQNIVSLYTLAILFSGAPGPV
jgi:hypothetical protein